MSSPLSGSTKPDGGYPSVIRTQPGQRQQRGGFFFGRGGPGGAGGSGVVACVQKPTCSVTVLGGALLRPARRRSPVPHRARRGGCGHRWIGAGALGRRFSRHPRRQLISGPSAVVAGAIAPGDGGLAGNGGNPNADAQQNSLQRRGNFPGPGGNGGRGSPNSGSFTRPAGRSRGVISRFDVHAAADGRIFS